MTSVGNAGCGTSLLCENNGFRNSYTFSLNHLQVQLLLLQIVTLLQILSGVCEFRTETCNNAGFCGVWYNNSSSCLSNPTYSNDPGDTDTSAYPCTRYFAVKNERV